MQIMYDKQKKETADNTTTTATDSGSNLTQIIKNKLGYKKEGQIKTSFYSVHHLHINELFLDQYEGTIEEKADKVILTIKTKGASSEEVKIELMENEYRLHHKYQPGNAPKSQYIVLEDKNRTSVCVVSVPNSVSPIQSDDNSGSLYEQQNNIHDGSSPYKKFIKTGLHFIKTHPYRT